MKTSTPEPVPYWNFSSQIWGFWQTARRSSNLLDGAVYRLRAPRARAMELTVTAIVLIVIGSVLIVGALLYLAWPMLASLCKGSSDCASDATAPAPPAAPRRPLLPSRRRQSLRFRDSRSAHTVSRNHT